jgi:hypothetical protein
MSRLSHYANSPLDGGFLGLTLLGPKVLGLRDFQPSCIHAQSTNLIDRQLLEISKEKAMTAIEQRPSTGSTIAAPRKSFILLVASILAFVVGFGSMAGGIFGAWYTWDQAVAQDVTTPEDAVISEAPVRGPFTMWAQADIITQHQLESTEGLYYSQMDRVVPQLDENGNAVLDENGEAVMIPNAARSAWLNATTLTTALSLGILSYALSAFAFVTGLTLVFVGYVFFTIRRKAVLL